MGLNVVVKKNVVVVVCFVNITGLLTGPKVQLFIISQLMHLW